MLFRDYRAAVDDATTATATTVAAVTRAGATGQILTLSSNFGFFRWL